MDIKFYIPSYETIPTELRLKVDNIDVYYKRIKGGFEFVIYTESDEKAMEIAEEIAQIMIRDHDESEHGVSWRTVSMELIPQDWEWRKVIEWKYRVRESY